MDFQTAFNFAAGAVGVLGGWLLNNLFQSQRDLSRADAELAAKVQGIEVLVAGQYIKRAEFDAKIDAVFDKLEKIETKLDLKLSGLKSQ